LATVNLKASDLKSIIEKLANRTLIEREPGSDLWPKLEPKVDLAGDYNLMFKWLKFALEVNYGGFFPKEGFFEAAIFSRWQDSPKRRSAPGYPLARL